MDASRIIVLSTPHELRRDFGDLVAGAEPFRPRIPPDGIWKCLEGGWLDEIWDPASPRGRATLDRFAALRAGIEGVVVIARSTTRTVLGELPGGDPLAVRLRQLRAGEAFVVLGHPVLVFDDRRLPLLGLIARHEDRLDLGSRIRRLANETVAVLVTGETGTGKEIVARAIHRLGRRASSPWLALNCAELPEGILEGELFGHVRGAFTGAANDRPGLFEAGGEGTVFLDEIGELPLAAQAKCLRVLEEHRVRRLGSPHPRPLSCRIVAATNRHLVDEIERGRFRADLFYRLRGAELRLRALREQPEQIVPAARRFLYRAALRFRRPRIELADEACLALTAHAWPGNVRELRQVIEAAVLSANGRVVRTNDLHFVERDRPLVSEPLVTVAALERAHILRALEATGGNRVAASRLLGVSRQSLARRMARLGVASPSRTGRSRPEAGTGNGHPTYASRGNSRSLPRGTSAAPVELATSPPQHEGGNRTCESEESCPSYSFSSPEEPRR